MQTRCRQEAGSFVGRKYFHASKHAAKCHALPKCPNGTVTHLGMHAAASVKVTSQCQAQTGNAMQQNKCTKCKNGITVNIIITVTTMSKCKAKFFSRHKQIPSHYHKEGQRLKHAARRLPQSRRLPLNVPVPVLSPCSLPRQMSLWTEVGREV